MGGRGGGGGGGGPVRKGGHGSPGALTTVTALFPRPHLTIAPAPVYYTKYVHSYNIIIL